MRFSGTAIAALLLHSSAESFFGSSLRTHHRLHNRFASGTGTGTQAGTGVNRWITSPTNRRATAAVQASTTTTTTFAAAATVGRTLTYPRKALLGYNNYGTCHRTNSHTTGLQMMTTAAARSLSTRGGTATTMTTTTTTTTALNSAVANELEKSTPVEVFRNDYRPLPYVVSKINMDFNIEDGVTTVKSELFIAPNPDITATTTTNTDTQDMVLDGDETCVKLLKLEIDGRDLVEHEEYEILPGKLIIKAHVLANNPTSVIQTTVQIVPEENTQLSGLYKSGPMYCTQCEAMGFRRITYYPDRPDNMAVFDRIRIEANKDQYPVLLSNGNLIEQGDIVVVDDNNNNDDDDDTGTRRHFAIWSDPFPKPSYLFCAVVGKLGSIQDSYTTMSGRKVQLEIFSEPENVNKLDYAMESLKRSMEWDEQTYGLEYDLDLYNIVAVNDFNMGAMENKGLNVFNTAYVLADPKTATDTDYERVEGVIGHEYFHNWTGNRVTCRDWFQLTLKEGLTVFRDQEFSGDMGSNAVKRIEDVRALRGRQFTEDNSPMAHPIRPDSYISMDNFYTATVYSKGAEVIRMYNTLLTKAGFRKGMDLYFARHDGSAVTCDDFRAAMADANDVDLDQFALWYSTPGTPTVSYSSSFDPTIGTFSLTLTQSSQSDQPLHIPVSVGLLDKETGDEVVPTTVLELRDMTQTFEFPDLQGYVIPSILRGFSAPVKLVPDSGIEDEDALAFLAARDTDGFNKWEAGQKLYTSLIFQTMTGQQSDKTMDLVLEAFGRTLASEGTSDYSIQAYALTLPGESTLAEQMDVIDPVGIRKSRGIIKDAIARNFKEELTALYSRLTETMKDEEFKVDAESTGKRRLRNVCLEYLCAIAQTPEEQKVAAELATAHFDNATGMTDRMAALSCLASMDGEGASARDAALAKFYTAAEGDALVLNKWFSVQALANLDDVLERVVALVDHPDFTLKNPNRCRSLISAFTMNAAPFHDENGKGYEFLADMLEKLDGINPQISSRMAGSLIQWRRYDDTRSELMKKQCTRLLNMPGISDDMYEILSRGMKE